MLENPVLEAYREHRRTIGTFLDLSLPLSAEALGISGLDYFIVDTEHSPAGLAETAACVRAAESRGITALTRIKHIDRGSVMKMLDIGVKGLIVPGIRKMSEIEQLIQYGKYPPEGQRGFCPTRVCAYGYNGAMKDGIAAYAREANEKTMLIPQCETADCLAMIEEVVRVNGVDGIFVGPFDLSLDLGIPGDFDNPVFKEALARVQKACRAAGKPLFIFAPDLKTTAERFGQGFDSVTYSSDLNMIVDGFKAALAAIKGDSI